MSTRLKLIDIPIRRNADVGITPIMPTFELCRAAATPAPDMSFFDLGDRPVASDLAVLRMYLRGNFRALST